VYSIENSVRYLLDQFAMHSKATTARSDEDLSRRVEELERELSEAYRREAATAELLKVISRSPPQLQPVLEAIVATASQLVSPTMPTCSQYETASSMPLPTIHEANPSSSSTSRIIRSIPSNEAQ
jgi:hypothetical protein